jgi:hypothetical protein
MKADMDLEESVSVHVDSECEINEEQKDRNVEFPYRMKRKTITLKD